jgi:hypothetical protein
VVLTSRPRPRRALNSTPVSSISPWASHLSTQAATLRTPLPLPGRSWVLRRFPTLEFSQQQPPRGAQLYVESCRTQVLRSLSRLPPSTRPATGSWPRPKQGSAVTLLCFDLTLQSLTSTHCRPPRCLSFSTFAPTRPLAAVDPLDLIPRPWSRWQSLLDSQHYTYSSRQQQSLKCTGHREPATHPHLVTSACPRPVLASFLRASSPYILSSIVCCYTLHNVGRKHPPP